MDNSPLFIGVNLHAFPAVSARLCVVDIVFFQLCVVEQSLILPTVQAFAVGQWHHVGFTISDALRLYIDGKAAGEARDAVLPANS
jgi:hypothetical protein